MLRVSYAGWAKAYLFTTFWVCAYKQDFAHTQQETRSIASLRPNHRMLWFTRFITYYNELKLQILMPPLLQYSENLQSVLKPSNKVFPYYFFAPKKGEGEMSTDKGGEATLRL